MYNKKSEQDSMKIITWTTLLTTSSTLLFLIGRGLVNKVSEGTAFGYIGLSFLFLITLCICTRTFFEIKSCTKKSKEEDNKDNEDGERLKLLKFKNGKFFQIGYWKPKMPGTVNTCPKKWKPSLIVKAIDGLKDYPNPKYSKN